MKKNVFEYKPEGHDFVKPFRPNQKKPQTKCNPEQFENYYFAQNPTEREKHQDSELSLFNPHLLKDIFEPFRAIP